MPFIESSLILEGAYWSQPVLPGLNLTVIAEAIGPKYRGLLGPTAD